MSRRRFSIYAFGRSFGLPLGSGSGRRYPGQWGVSWRRKDGGAHWLMLWPKPHRFRKMRG